MKNSDKKYNEIINELKDTNPVLQNKKELTDEIISKIKNENGSTSKSRIIFIQVIRPAMTAAAIFLVGLFLFQQSENSTIEQTASFTIKSNMNESTVLEQINTNEIKLSRDLKTCLKIAEKDINNLDRKCAAKLLFIYKKLELEKTPFYKKKNWFNH